MEYLCKSCEIGLTKWEVFLNKKYPVGHLFCEFCQSKHERELIKKIADDEADMTDDYTRTSFDSPKIRAVGDNIEEDYDEVN
tara:strand:+ start:88 stop:333 length:246 start_codon:yes stop_codon:yes gene_type:complete